MTYDEYAALNAVGKDASSEEHAIYESLQARARVLNQVHDLVMEPRDLGTNIMDLASAARKAQYQVDNRRRIEQAVNSQIQAKVQRRDASDSKLIDADVELLLNGSAAQSAASWVARSPRWRRWRGTSRSGWCLQSRWPVGHRSCLGQGCGG